MMKKVLSFILVLSLLLTCASSLVVAEPAPTYGLDAKTVTVGDEFTMTVSIANNPGIISLRFTVEYDSEKLQLLEVSDLKLLNGFTTPSPTISSPYTLRWADNLATTNNTANGNVVTLKFKALAETDAATVSIKHAEARNATGKKVTFENVSANVKVNAKQVAAASYGLDAKTVTVDDEFTMTVMIANNPGIISLRFTVEYDSEKLQLLEVSDLKLLNGFTTPSPTISSPYTLRWADNLATTNNTANGNVVTLKFKALAETDATAVSIKHAEARNATGSKVTFANASANVKVNAKQVAVCDHENAQKVAGKAATCTENGLKDYWHCPDCEKNFSDSACKNEISGNLDTWRVIDKLGHSYGTPTYVWNGDQCTAKRVCSHDGSHIETETVTGIYVKDTDAACEANEKGHYEATFQNGAFAKQSTAKNSAEKLNSALGHNYEWVIDQNATKTSTGLKHEECTRCHAKRNENTVIPILTCDHKNAQKVAGKAATCTENGLKEYWHCPDCEKNFSDSACKNEISGNLDAWRIIDKLGHSYGTPTYVWNGDQCTAKRVCSHDGSHIETETVTGIYVKDTDAACEANEKGHYEATFQNGAFAKQSTAKNSAEKLNSALGHNYEWVIDQNATKTATGLKHEECTRCHAKRNENTVIPILTCDHKNAQKVAGKAATCTETGLKEYWHCPDCGKNFSDSACQLEIAENLDAWRVIDKLGHSFTNYVSDNNATCTKDGTKTAHCDHAGCNATDTIADVGSKLGHNYEKPTYTWNGDKCTATMVCLNDSGHEETETATAKYVKDTNATCTENEKGHYEVTFQNGAFEKQTTAKNSVEKQGTKLGHNYVAVVTPPTETERGYTTHTCSRCHDSYVDSYTDPIAPSHPKGDVTGDNIIDAFDYQMLKAYVLGTYTDVTPEQKQAMDINGDNSIDAFDYQMVKAHVLGTYVIQ